MKTGFPMEVISARSDFGHGCIAISGSALHQAHSSSTSLGALQPRKNSCARTDNHHWVCEGPEDNEWSRRIDRQRL